jgi:hypothetical protein
MVRTQIYIPEQIHETAKNIAKRKDTSVAEVYRGYIKKGLGSEKVKSGSVSALLSLKIRGGPKDLSANMDKYLYD